MVPLFKEISFHPQWIDMRILKISRQSYGEND